MTTDPVLELEGVRFGWTPDVPLINIAQFRVMPGESVFLRGPSGSGKSTLLGLIGGVITPQAGRISIGGHDLTALSGTQTDTLRADHLGIIFQQFNLLPYLDVVQNILLPCRFSQLRRKRALASGRTLQQEATRLASSLGLSPADITKPVGALSVGQQQRVAVARALIGGPDLIIADEPTSALDHNNRDRFIALLNEQRQAIRSSLLFVSHDETLSRHFDTALDLTDINQKRAA